MFGASSGIGKATKKLLESNGYTLKTFSRRKSEENCSQHFLFDVRYPYNKVTSILDKAIMDGFLGGLVYSVTDRFPKADLLSYTEDDFIDSIKTSTIGLYQILRWASLLDSKFIDEESKPSIVILSSNSASSVSPYSGFLYSHSKASQLSLCRYYAKYFNERKGWRLNVLTPGLVITELSKSILGEEFLKTQEYIKPDDVAEIIGHLLSSESRIIANQQIFIHQNKYLEYRHLYQNIVKQDINLPS